MYGTGGLFGHLTDHIGSVNKKAYGVLVEPLLFTVGLHQLRHLCRPLDFELNLIVILRDHLNRDQVVLGFNSHLMNPNSVTIIEWDYVTATAPIRDSMETLYIDLRVAFGHFGVTEAGSRS